MKIVDSLVLHEFLNDHSSNMVLIHFNEDFFNETTQNQLSFQDFKGKWLLCEYEESNDKEMTGNLLYCDSEKFSLYGEKFPLTDFYLTLIEIHNTWISKYPDIEFPNIVISSNKSLRDSACLIFNFNANRYSIHLTLSDLLSINRFKYVIGHELGHLVYKYKMATLLEKNINNKRYLSLFPWEALVLFVLHSYIGLLIISLNLHLLVSTFCLVSIVFWSLFLFISLVSFPRLKNYQMEFFCDYFSFYTFGTIPVSDLGLNDTYINAYSHPSNRLRKNELKNFKPSNSLNEWSSPILANPFYFRIINFYEFIFSLHLVCNSVFLFFKRKIKY